MNLKQRLSNGEIVNGIMLSELYTPNIVRILANCGYDYVLVDCEHGYFDLSQVANLIAVADGAGLPIWIRVTNNSQADIAKYLDMGAHGILLSNTESVEQVRNLVRMCLYAPQGDRGVSTFRAHTNYRHEDMRTVMERANARNVVIAQIESPAAAEQIDGILDVEGLDGVLIGPNDLTMHMGVIGDYRCAQVESVLQKVAISAKEHGKWSGIITGNQALLHRCREMDMHCFSSGSELNALELGAKENLAKLKQAQQL